MAIDELDSHRIDTVGELETALQEAISSTMKRHGESDPKYPKIVLAAMIGVIIKQDVEIAKSQRGRPGQFMCALLTAVASLAIGI